jgi:protein subunit release factor B
VAKVFLHNFEHELEEKFVTAGGPGGQNVNKVATAVQIRWNVKKSHAFDDEQKWMIRRALENRINDEGELVLFIQTHRSQARNREEARERLVELLEKALDQAQEAHRHQAQQGPETPPPRGQGESARK